MYKVGFAGVDIHYTLYVYSLFILEAQAVLLLKGKMKQFLLAIPSIHGILTKGLH